MVTSGLGDQLPSNLYVGEVTQVENDQYGLAKELRVKTAADLGDLNHVYIAKRDPKRFPMMKAGMNNAIIFICSLELCFLYRHYNWTNHTI